MDAVNTMDEVRRQQRSEGKQKQKETVGNSRTDKHEGWIGEFDR